MDVDDMKISQVDPEVVTSMINKLESKFGKMTIKRGKEHTFLGMHIRYTEKGTAVMHHDERLFTRSDNGVRTRRQETGSHTGKEGLVRSGCARAYTQEG
jgi:hypothetical protein